MLSPIASKTLPSSPLDGGFQSWGFLSNFVWWLEEVFHRGFLLFLECEHCVILNLVNNVVFQTTTYVLKQINQG